MNLEAIALSAFISVATGLIASFCFFLFLLKFYQPKIEIAVEAVRAPTNDGKEVLKVKVRNLRKRPISGIRAELHRLRFVERENGFISQTHLLPLIRSDPLGLGPRDDPSNSDIYVFRTLEKTRKYASVIEAMNEHLECKLLFRILVIDGHSGLGKLFGKTYRWPRDVRRGEYIAGRDITVTGLRRNSEEPSNPFED